MGTYARYSGLLGSTGGGGGSGTVTSVGFSDNSTTPIYTITGSPVTTAGTLIETLKTQTANTIFSGPTTGAAAQPTFRALVAADIPTGNLTDAGTDGIVVTGGTGAVIGSGTSLAQHVADTTHNGYLSSTDWNTFNGKQASGNYITALTGDVTATGPGSVAAVLAATTNATLTTISSLVSVGTITTGTWNATTIAINHGGTGQTTANAAFNALSPMTTLGDIEYEDATPKAVRLAGNTTATKNFLTQTGTGTISAAPTWGTIASGDVPTLNQNTTGTASNVTGTVLIAHGGTGQTTQTTGFDALQPMTTGGDIIYGGTSGTGTRLANGSSGQVLTSSGGTAAPTWATPASAPRSELYLQGANGYGSTSGNRIRRFTTTQVQTGTAITYSNSSTNGDNFTINEDGLYAITYCAEFTAAETFGISINASSLTTSILSITASGVAAVSETSANGVGSSVSTVMHLSVNDVVRCQNADVQADSGNAVQTSFRLCKINS